MKVTLHTATGPLPIRATPGLAFAFVDIACPSCAAPAPMKIKGIGRRIHSHDTYAADARTLCCGASVGEIRAQVETLFGLEEDEAVLRHGRGRVYG